MYGTRELHCCYPYITYGIYVGGEDIKISKYEELIWGSEYLQHQITVYMHARTNEAIIITATSINVQVIITPIKTCHFKVWAYM